MPDRADLPSYSGPSALAALIRLNYWSACLINEYEVLLWSRGRNNILYRTSIMVLIVLVVILKDLAIYIY